MTVTHLSTIEAEVRRIANSSDLTHANLQFFLKATFVSDFSVYAQRLEQAAFDRGMQAATQSRMPLGK